MRSVSAARIDPYRDAPLLIDDEPTTNAQTCKVPSRRKSAQTVAPSAAPSRPACGGRFCRNASMPSRASSETNSVADCVGQRLGVARRTPRGSPPSSAPSTPPNPAASPSRSSAASAATVRVDVVGGDGDQADVRGLGGAELLAGDEVAARGPGGHLRQQRQRDDRRGDADARLGQREGARRPGDDDVARADQTQAAGPDVAVDRARSPASASSRIARSSCGHLAGPVDGQVAGVAAGRLAEVGARAERAAGVAEHDARARRVGRGRRDSPSCSCSTSAVDSALRLCGESSVSRATAPSSTA